MKEMKRSTNLGLDAASAQLASSVKEAIRNSAKSPDLRLPKLKELKYAYCFESDAYLNTREELFYFLHQRALHFFDIEYQGAVTDILRPVHTGTNINPVDYKLFVENFTNICPVTGLTDLCKITVHTKNMTNIVEIGELKMVLGLFYSIAIYHECLGDFLKYFFQNVFLTDSVYIHLDSSAVHMSLRTLTIS